ncbi:MAG: ATP-dependent sacrificial sulfur transferase LarE [Fuerstiella sp.]
MNTMRQIKEHPTAVSDKAAELVAHISTYGSVAVAFSGGVDSGVVAQAALLALGPKAVAITAVSPSLADAELRTARDEAALIGIRHVEIDTQEFARPEYRANAGDRCFYCKDTLYTLAASKLAELGVQTIVNGANTDDLGEHRPGMQAATQHDVRSPLIEVGINKDQVRELARFWNLTIAEKPASPCLSSRVAYGVEVTEERVQRVERAEALLRALTASAELRVRCEAGDLARIEVPVSLLPRIVEPQVRSEITKQLREFGFRRVTLDLEGFRSGSLNDALPVVSLQVHSH